MSATLLQNFYGAEGFGFRNYAGALPAPGGLELMALKALGAATGIHGMAAAGAKSSVGGTLGSLTTKGGNVMGLESLMPGSEVNPLIGMMGGPKGLGKVLKKGASMILGTGDDSSMDSTITSSTVDDGSGTTTVTQTVEDVPLIGSGQATSHMGPAAKVGAFIDSLSAKETKAAGGVVKAVGGLLTKAGQTWQAVGHKMQSSQKTVAVATPTTIVYSSSSGGGSTGSSGGVAHQGSYILNPDGSTTPLAGSSGGSNGVVYTNGGGPNGAAAGAGAGAAGQAGAGAGLTAGPVSLGAGAGAGGVAGAGAGAGAGGVPGAGAGAGAGMSPGLPATTTFSSTNPAVTAPAGVAAPAPPRVQGAGLEAGAVQGVDQQTAALQQQWLQQWQQPSMQQQQGQLSPAQQQQLLQQQQQLQQQQAQQLQQQLLQQQQVQLQLQQQQQVQLQQQQQVQLQQQQQQAQQQLQQAQQRQLAQQAMQPQQQQMLLQQQQQLQQARQQQLAQQAMQPQQQQVLLQQQQQQRLQQQQLQQQQLRLQQAQQQQQQAQQQALQSWPTAAVIPESGAVQSEGEADITGPFASTEAAAAAAFLGAGGDWNLRKAGPNTPAGRAAAQYRKKQRVLSGHQ